MQPVKPTLNIDVGSGVIGYLPRCHFLYLDISGYVKTNIKQVGLSRATLEFQVQVFNLILLQSQVKVLNRSAVTT